VAVDRGLWRDGVNYPCDVRVRKYASTAKVPRAKCEKPIPQQIKGDFYGQPIRLARCLHPTVELLSINSDQAEIFDWTPSQRHDGTNDLPGHESPELGLLHGPGGSANSTACASAPSIESFLADDRHRIHAIATSSRYHHGFHHVSSLAWRYAYTAKPQRHSTTPSGGWWRREHWRNCHSQCNALHLSERQPA